MQNSYNMLILLIAFFGLLLGTILLLLWIYTNDELIMRHLKIKRNVYSIHYGVNTIVTGDRIQTIEKSCYVSAKNQETAIRKIKTIEFPSIPRIIKVVNITHDTNKKNRMVDMGVTFIGEPTFYDMDKIDYFLYEKERK